MGAMCGRYANARGAAELSAFFEAYDETGGQLSAAYNIAPTDPVPLVRAEGATRRLSMARWGLPRPWDRRSRQVMINARSETVATSRAFSAAFARRRCLIPADGWYEWVPLPDGVRRPYFMTPHDGAPLAFAGLWNPAGDGAACAVITTAAAGGLAEVHDRMPLVLPAPAWQRWLHSDDPVADLLAGPGADWAAGIEIRPVGRAVGDIHNDGPALIARAAASQVPSAAAGPAEMTLF